MNEAVFYAKYPNGFLAERKQLKVSEVLIGCSGKKRSCADANKAWKKLSLSSITIMYSSYHTQPSEYK